MSLHTSSTDAQLPLEGDREPTLSQILTAAACDRTHVSGLTHNFYRYPARFSPSFAAAAIDCFSKRGELVMDPYMGGGTAIVEALASGRRAVGNDLNSLAVFVARVKTTTLTADEVRGVKEWARHIVPYLSYRLPITATAEISEQAKMRNLHLPKARYIAKCVAVARTTIADLQTENARNFARCALLRVAQLALDGRKNQMSLASFRGILTTTTMEMLRALGEFRRALKQQGISEIGNCTLCHGDASHVGDISELAGERKVGLVVTSPPYPGVHMLYHRWQVDGRKETPAPYWIANCQDGNGCSYYNFGSRRESSADNYFNASLRTLLGIRGVMRSGGVIVQMIAFSRPDQHLARYLQNMEAAGFEEMRLRDAEAGRIWRDVPNRRWHAVARGRTNSSREVVLIHRAI